MPGNFGRELYIVAEFWQNIVDLNLLVDLRFYIECDETGCISTKSMTLSVPPPILVWEFISNRHRY